MGESLPRVPGGAQCCRETLSRPVQALRVKMVLLGSSGETFIRVLVWLKELEKQYIPGSTVIWLVGNKGDLEQDRQVSVQEGQSLANDRGLFFMETSALSGDQVCQLLLSVGPGSTPSSVSVHVPDVELIPLPFIQCLLPVIWLSGDPISTAPLSVVLGVIS
ncbi:hypothetical protein FQN60_001536 [Etheostoma spectabile]|uniref:Small monomeric GTPase n=1 Tax=Etheostoma spectabile TaxID=54343 RepID=A0A5J5D0Y7_9PERO|nr:hypothetical protein FQN60_001536 [Etheostoma spectabile]